jgi:hypothetical protein
MDYGGNPDSNRETPLSCARRFLYRSTNARPGEIPIHRDVALYRRSPRRVRAWRKPVQSASSLRSIMLESRAFQAQFLGILSSILYFPSSLVAAKGRAVPLCLRGSLSRPFVPSVSSFFNPVTALKLQAFDCVFAPLRPCVKFRTPQPFQFSVRPPREKTFQMELLPPQSPQ